MAASGPILGGMSRRSPFAAVDRAGLAAACASTGATPRPFPVRASIGARRRNARCPGRAGREPRPPPRQLLPRRARMPTATRSPARRWRCAVRRTATAAPTPTDSTAAASRSTSSRSTACRCRATVARSVPGGQAGRRPKTLAAGRLWSSSRPSPPARRTSAIAIGGDEFVHAPSSTGVVRVEHLSASYWSLRASSAADDQGSIYAARNGPCAINRRDASA